MFWPNAVTTGGYDAVRVDGIFDRLVKSQQRVIVEGIDFHDRILIRGTGSVLAPAILRREIDHLVKGVPVLLIGRLISAHRKAEDEDRCAFPIPGGKRKTQQRHAKFLGSRGEYLISL